MRRYIAPLFVLLVLSGIFFASRPIIADHNAVSEFDKIPSEWILAAKSMFRATYGHTSHGSQIISGMEALEATDKRYAFYDDFSRANLLPQSTLSLWDGRMSGASDLGNPNRYAWKTATEKHLNGAGSGRNLVMWSWCGQASTATSSQIQNDYLSNMASLEARYPDVVFVYMTGHTDGTGSSGNLNLRNKQIRDYAKANGKVLFDFADIESWSPDGKYYPDATDSCAWCKQWCVSNHSDCESLSFSCAHSHPYNCKIKAKAFWWMMARLAGWDGTTTTPVVPASAPVAPAVEPETSQVTQPQPASQESAQTTPQEKPAPSIKEAQQAANWQEQAVQPGQQAAGQNIGQPKAKPQQTADATGTTKTSPWIYIGAATAIMLALAIFMFRQQKPKEPEIVRAEPPVAAPVPPEIPKA